MPPLTQSGDSPPTAIRLRRRSRVVEVDFADGTRYSFSFEYLRTHSPSAEVQGHGPGQRMYFGGKKSVGITAVEPVGHYAVRLVFDDGHDSGIYSWDYLFQLGAEYGFRWAEYLAALASRGLSR